MYEPNSPIVEAKLKIVNEEFKRGKGSIAARQIILWKEELSKDDLNVLIKEIDIAPKTLEGVLTKLRKLKLYPPQELSHPSIPEKPQEVSHHVPEARQPSSEYVTREDFETQFETLKNSINYLASVISGEPLPNPGGEPPLNPGEYPKEEDDIEAIHPEEMVIQNPSLTRTSIYIKPKTQLYYDMAREGTFANYVDSREMGPLTKFNGNLSDFFDIIVDDYFIRLFNADIGLMMRRYVR